MNRREAWKAALPAVALAQILVTGCQEGRTEKVLPWPTITAAELSFNRASEQEMFLLVNMERFKLGMQLLVWDEELAEVARNHARDMLQRGYFNHISPDGQGPADRLKAGGIIFNSAGENLAYARNVSSAHRGLMESPNHQRTMLNPTFTKAGVAVVKGLEIFEKLMMVQMFTN